MRQYCGGKGGVSHQLIGKDAGKVCIELGERNKHKNKTTQRRKPQAEDDSKGQVVFQEEGVQVFLLCGTSLETLVLHESPLISE